MAHQFCERTHSHGIVVRVHQDDDGPAYVVFTTTQPGFAPTQFTEISIPDAKQRADDILAAQEHQCDNNCGDWTPVRATS